MTHEQAVQKQSVERYLLEEMPEIERFAFEEHLFTCELCAEDVRVGALMHDGVVAGLLPQASAKTAGLGVRDDDTRQEAGLDAGTAPPTPQKVDSAWQGVVPWAVAAMLALAVGYQTMWVVPGLRDAAVGPTVLSPVMLRGATRGAEPIVVRPEGGLVSLAVDLPGVAAGGRLTYDLRAPGGTPVATGTAAAPSPGSPLLLLIPSSSLREAGGYGLAVTPAGAQAAVEYRFTVEPGK